MNRRQFLLRAFQIGGIAALWKLGVPYAEARSIQDAHKAVIAARNAGGGGSVSASDDFTGEDANPIGGNWTTVTDQGDIRRNDGHACGATAGNNKAYWNADSFPANQYAQCVLGSAAFSYSGVMVRCSSIAATFYLFANNTTNSYKLTRVIDGSSTEIYDYTDETPAPDDVIKLVVSGTTLTPYVNGTPLASKTDSNIATGQPGISVYSTNDNRYIDDFVAGE